MFTFEFAFELDRFYCNDRPTVTIFMVRIGLSLQWKKHKYFLPNLC